MGGLLLPSCPASVTGAQFRGSLLGQCLGDALGFVVEGYPPEVCSEYVDGTLRAGRAGQLGRGTYPFGQYTDDSQLARELLQSMIGCGGFRPADYATRVAALFAEGRVVGRGRTTEHAADRLASGVPWDRAGAPSPAAGNGSAMRAGPVGLMYAADSARLVEVARDQGRVTHQDPRCCAGAVAIAGAVSLALEPDPVDAARFTSRLAALVEPLEADVAAAIERLERLAALGPDAAFAEIASTGAPDVDDGWQGISPFVTPSVLWSLYAFLRTPDDYWETICTAIAVGGDVDTTAAMAGAMSGAHVGLDGLPLSLARRVTDRGTWGFEELVALADAARELAQGAQRRAP
jgi:ADP-ribosylglycohydrolase